MKWSKRIKNVISITLICLLMAGLSPLSARYISADDELTRAGEGAHPEEGVFPAPDVSGTPAENSFEATEDPAPYVNVANGLSENESSEIEKQVSKENGNVREEEIDDSLNNLDSNNGSDVVDQRDPLFQEPLLPTFQAAEFIYPREDVFIPKFIQISSCPENVSMDPSIPFLAHWEVQLDDGSWQVIDETSGDVPFELEKSYRVHFTLPASAFPGSTPPVEIKLDKLHLTLEAESGSNPYSEEQVPDEDQASRKEQVSNKEQAPSEDQSLTEDQSLDNERSLGEDQSRHEEPKLHYFSRVLKVGDIELLDSFVPLRAPSGTGNAIYLDGVKGDDVNDGSVPEKPVKTFTKAKDLARDHQNIEKIIVIGTTDISGEVSLAGTKAELVRGEAFNGYLLRLTGSSVSATLQDIVIDGNSENNTSIEDSLIKVDSGTTLNIGKGAVLRNNKIKDKPNTATTGGAIYAYSATVNMTGGSVEGNQATYGGGIYLYQSSTMNFSGGTVQNNSSRTVTDNSVTPTQYYSAGGGIVAYENSKINMSGNATVLNNYAQEIGGGISLGCNQVGNGSYLNMNGGTIEGNTAGATGGGIFIQCGYFGNSFSKASIKSGYIINNKKDQSGKTEDLFGGGGIYVNGAVDMPPFNGTNGVLHLENALITNNTCEITGAGYAACPISQTTIYVTDGCAIYANEAKGGFRTRSGYTDGFPENNGDDTGNEVYVLCKYEYGLHGGNPEYVLSQRMLGGTPYRWKLHDGSLLPKDKYTGKLEEDKAYLALHTDEIGNKLTQQLAKVVISGNDSASRGGGIGSNGTVIFGKPGTTEVSVQKRWEDNHNAEQKRPSSIEVELLAELNGKYYVVDKATLSENNQWNYTFEDLPAEMEGQKAKYSVREISISGYTGTVTGDAEKGFLITNTPSPTPPPVEFPFKITVHKQWVDENNQNGLRPAKVAVMLYADGVYTGKHMNLLPEYDWSAVFRDLPEYEGNHKIVYSLREEIVPHYDSHITGDSNTGFIVTNTLRSRPVQLPRTGESDRITIGLSLPLLLSGLWLCLKKKKLSKV